jgi:adenylosuccinate lyase
LTAAQQKGNSGEKIAQGESMIERYTRPEMAALWSQENKYRKWLDVEIWACEAMAELGIIPQESMAIIKKKANFDAGRIDEIEKITRHDVIAFLTNVGEHVGTEARFIHMGLTSSDVLDTAMAILLKEAADIIIADSERFMEVLKRRALEHKHTVMIGRSHGIHAEPTTFGLKLAIWYDEMRRNLDRLHRAREIIACGAISGAVGTFANIPPEIEAYVCHKAGLKPAPASSQIVQRDRYAEYFSTLAIVAATLEKIALEIRHLQRTEVREAEEYFAAGQKGSSAMPHKRNPISAENICGLARVVRSNALAALENVALWHERDISHSSVERIIAPDSTTLVNYMLNRLTAIVDRLVVYPEAMKRNLELTHGLIYSQQLLLALARKGASREDAYRVVQKAAMDAWEGKDDFKQLLITDGEISCWLSQEEIDNIFNLNYHLTYVDYIFDRVLGPQ